MKVINVPTDSVMPNPEQPRKIFRDEELGELTNSIKEYGILQPLIVKKAGSKKYLLVAGERRLRAAKLAGFTNVPVIIREFEDKDSAVVSLVENVQREELNFLEEARAYKKLLDDFGLTQGEVAESVGKKQSTISNKIRILSLPEDIQGLIVECRLTERHARALLKLSDEKDRKKVIERVVENNLNVKQTEKLIDDILAGREKKERDGLKKNYINYKIYLNTIKKAFNQVKSIEKNAKYTENDQGEFLELKIIIPKNDKYTMLNQARG